MRLLEPTIQMKDLKRDSSYYVEEIYEADRKATEEKIELFIVQRAWQGTE